MTKGERTKERIRQGVRNLLASRDFMDIGIDDVVEETDVPVGSIYFHFKNKDRLMEEVAENGIESFFDYFVDIEEEDLFGAIFLYCWRSTQQYVDRRGDTQLVQWYLGRQRDRLEAGWMPRRIDLVKRLAAIATAEIGQPEVAPEDITLIETLMTGTEQMLIFGADQTTDIRKTQDETPVALAKRLSTSWYRAIVGPAYVLPCNADDTIKGIVKRTKMLQRPIDLG